MPVSRPRLSTGLYGSSHGGADLTDLVPFVQGSAKSTAVLKQVVEKGAGVILAEDLDIVAKLGEGGFGVVYKCRVSQKLQARAQGAGPDNGSPMLAQSAFVAVKRLKTVSQMRAERMRTRAPNDTTVAVQASVDKQHAEALAEFAHEVLMLKKLSHPNIITYLGCAILKDAASMDDDPALVLEFASGGSLKDMITAPAGLSHAYTVREGLKWALDVAKGMQFLHKCTPPIIHRDLKPGNIMLCGPERTAKVADFGLASLELERRKEEARKAAVAEAVANAGGSGSGKGGRTGLAQFRQTGGVGSLRYMAPENFRGEAYTHTVDQYSFGIICYELLLRQRAWATSYMEEAVIAESAAGPKQMRPPVPKQWPPEVHAFFAECWHRNPAQRPEFKQVAAILAAWQNSSASEKLLTALAKGSKQGLLERMGIKKSV